MDVIVARSTNIQLEKVQKNAGCSCFPHDKKAHRNDSFLVLLYSWVVGVFFLYIRVQSQKTLISSLA